ncbi:ergothioneine biosynthesis protein EgtB [Nodularia chucula]|uniref:ergothioneine biosynthesis protein EgtB n=1 Tax=Nodularia chucula TaxID=3093667 RepID=UPI0039C6A9F9
MISRLYQSSLKETLFNALVECRRQTWKLFEGMDESTFCCQPHPDFSPVGWHLGHIGYTESLWLLEHSGGLPCPFPQYRKLFAADGLPKSKRVQLPDLEETLYYLDRVRKQVLQRLEVVDVAQEEPLWRFLIQHESQHYEIISFVLQLIQGEKLEIRNMEANFNSVSAETNLTEMVLIPAGEFERGSDDVDALDNERPAHKVYLDTYYIDRYPVTCGQYRLFMEAGGYEDCQWWSNTGWKWRQRESVVAPLYWSMDQLRDNHPVYGVSWYEAQAYSRFVGKRLPTEAEWEKAASWDAEAGCRRFYPWGNESPNAKYSNCDHLIGNTTPVDAYPSGQSAYGLYDTLGNIWEWTGSWFEPYDGFQSYPYVGYSQVYFDQKHRVLKGGSWATRPWGLRASFRNWYYPHVRQIFAGFRCAASSLSKIN